jgi:small-conductance mechanosensitive channel
MDWKIFGKDIPPWIYAPVLLAGWWAVGLLVKAALALRLKSETAASRSRFLTVLIRALSVPLVLFIFVSGPIALLAWTPLGEGIREKVNLNILLGVAAIIAAFHFADRLLRGLISDYTPRVELFRSAGNLIKGISRALLIILAGLMLLDTLGISITPIIASLGIGTLAVALALQPTLENLFAGMQIVMDRPVLPGHFVKLESGEEGYVEKIGWRSTWIRMLSNNMIIIPNKDLVDSRVVNYYYPSKDLAVLVDLGVHYGSDLEKVQRVTIEVGESVMKSVTGGVPDFKPFIRFNKFADSSIDFTVILRAQEFVDNYLIKHEFIKALHERYAKEKITIPYPIRAINLEQEKVDQLLPRREK